MVKPETKYARVGDASVAYQVVGDGPIDLVYVTGLMSHVDLRWDFPPEARFMERLASFSRLILFDRRGAGASDRLPSDALPPWEDFADDLRAVLNAVNSERAVIFAILDAGPWAMLFAATEPDRTAALVLMNTTAKYVADETFPEGVPRETTDALTQLIEEHWGTEKLAAVGGPGFANDPVASAWVATYQRAAGTPRAAAAQFRHSVSVDLRDMLPLIDVSTLVLHSEGFPFTPITFGRHLAANLPRARLIVLPGSDPLPVLEHADTVLEAVEEFLTGTQARAAADRVLATVLFTDIVGSTERAARLGDRAWRNLLSRHHAVVRECLRRHGGREVDTAGDGFFAVFDGPTRALRCALDATEAIGRLGLHIRAGVHSGECERIGDKIAGVAVVIGARVMSEADADEVLCSRTVKDLVGAGGFRFEDRGARALKGVPDDWQLYSVTR